MTNLLVIDDEKNVLDALEMIFADLGYQVQALASGKEALKVLDTAENERPDLIITDIVMAEMSGLQFFEAARASADLSETPFLFISAHITSEIERLIQQQHKTAFLRKPFEVETLIETVAALCGLN